jgi:hypothetical protein
MKLVLSNQPGTEVMEWMLSHHLCINPKKTVFLPITRQMSLSEIMPLKLGAVSIDPSEKARNLGFIFVNKLSHEHHVAHIRKQCFFHLRRLSGIRASIPENMFLSLVHAFITSRLDFCNSLFYGLPKSRIKKLRNIQNAVAKCVLRGSKLDSSKQALIDLHWLPVLQRITFKTALMAFKVNSGDAPSYMREEIFKLTPIRNTRSASDGPKLNSFFTRARLKSCGDRTYQLAITSTWNSLPTSLRECTSLAIFKSKLKTHLFNRAF